MINPDNFKPVDNRRASPKRVLQLTVSKGSINISPALVEFLTNPLDITDVTPSGKKRLYVKLGYSRTDKALHVSVGTPEDGFLFLLSRTSNAANAPRFNGRRNTPALLRDMGLTEGTYIRKFPDQPHVFVLDVKIKSTDK